MVVLWVISEHSSQGEGVLVPRSLSPITPNFPSNGLAWVDQLDELEEELTNSLVLRPIFFVL